MITASIPQMIPTIKLVDEDEPAVEADSVSDPPTPAELDALALLLDVATPSLRHIVTSCTPTCSMSSHSRPTVKSEAESPKVSRLPKKSAWSCVNDRDANAFPVRFLAQHKTSECKRGPPFNSQLQD